MLIETGAPELWDEKVIYTYGEDDFIEQFGNLKRDAHNPNFVDDPESSLLNYIPAYILLTDNRSNDEKALLAQPFNQLYDAPQRRSMEHTFS